MAINVCGDCEKILLPKCDEGNNIFLQTTINSGTEIRYYIQDPSGSIKTTTTLTDLSKKITVEWDTYVVEELVPYNGSFQITAKVESTGATITLNGKDCIEVTFGELSYF